MLTEAERNLVKRVFALGPGTLLDEGYTPDTASVFLSRIEVNQFLTLLLRESQVSDVTASRTKFLGRRELSPLLNPSVATIARALMGPVYVRAPDGSLIRDAKGRYLVTDPGPTAMQLSAATDVLDRLNVRPESKVVFSIEADATLPVLPAVASESTALESHNFGVTEEERSLSRERIRNVLSALAPSVKTIRDKVEDLLPKRVSKATTARSERARKSRKPKKKNVATPQDQQDG